MQGVAQLTRVSAEVFQDGTVRVYIRLLESGERLNFDGDSAHRLAAEILRVLEKAERAAHGVTLEGMTNIETRG